METCPIGYFCFDKNTFMLFIICGIIFVVYKIHTSNDKYNIQKDILNNKRDMMKDIKNRLDETKSYVDNLKKQNLHLERKNAINIHHTNEEMYIIDKDHQRIVNPLVPPERSYPYIINRVGVPINIPTRGYSSNYQQVGALVQ